MRLQCTVWMHQVTIAANCWKALETDLREEELSKLVELIDATE